MLQQKHQQVVKQCNYLQLQLVLLVVIESTIIDIFLGDGLVIANSTTFHIQTVKLHNTGDYTCSAYNSLGHDNKNFHVEVWQKPFFTVIPISKAFPSSSTVKMECRASGVPEPRITWLKDGKPLKFDARVKKQVNRLFFSNSVTSDSGKLFIVCCFFFINILNK